MSAADYGRAPIQPFESYMKAVSSLSKLIPRCLPAVFFAFFLGLSLPANAQMVTFDLDTGTPALTVGQNVPFDQASGGITAQFSSPQGASFSIQTDTSTGFQMSQFSGHHLYPNNTQTNTLDIKFSLDVINITFTFATTDFPPIEIPSLLQLTAYQNSTNTPAVGSMTTNASYGSDTMPMGVLTFQSATPFNLVTIRMAPNQPSAGFLLDNITVTQIIAPARPQLTIFLTSTNPAVISWPTNAIGFVVRQNSALGAANWANTTDTVNVVGSQNQVLVSPGAGKCFYRLFHP